EILFDEIRAFPVNGLCKRHRFLLALAPQLQPADSFFKRSIDEYVKRIGSGTKVICRPAAYNHGVSFMRDFRKNLLYDFTDTLCIDHSQPAGIEAALEAAAHERLQEPVESRISFFFMLLDVAAIALHPARDLIRQYLVPEFPAEARGRLLRDD